MNKKIGMIYIILMIMIISIVSAIEIGTTEVNVEVTTSENIDSIIIENSEGNIHNEIYCNGASCNTNVIQGTIVVPQGQNFTYNEYSYTTTSGGKGLTISKLNTRLGVAANDYYFNLKDYGKDYWYDFWIMMDTMFVSHKEYDATYGNVLYLAEENDRIKAENTVLRSQLNITLNPQLLKCQTALNKAHRIGSKVEFDGWVVDPNVFGEKCVKIVEDN